MTRDVETDTPELPAAMASPPAAVLRPLEFLLDPAAAALIGRLPGLVRTAPSRPAALVWHDDQDGTLAAQGFALMRDGQTWSMQAIEPGAAYDWPPCSPPPPLGEGAVADLSPTPPFDAAPVAGFAGRRAVYADEAVQVTVLHGTLRGLFDDRPACRVDLTGPAPALMQWIDRLAECRAAVPRASLAAEALAAAKGRRLPARHLGAPSVTGDTALSDGLARIVGHLLDTLLYWADEFRRERRPEPVHQARVAIRRLRSALSLYRRALPAPELTELAASLRACAARLGEARDWDVFLAETGAQLAAMAANDGRIGALLRGAERQRQAAYVALDAYLDGPEFRRIELRLGAAASLRPWERDAVADAIGLPTADFAAVALTRRLRHVRRRGRRLDTLPVAELHEMRKDCKRLRYAAEFFAPSFPDSKDVRPFVKRLSALQEQLGLLNDAAVAGHLMGQLGRLGRGFAGGVVEGWAAAACIPARGRIEQSWRRFKDVSPFWTR